MSRSRLKLACLLLVLGATLSVCKPSEAEPAPVAPSAEQPGAAAELGPEQARAAAAIARQTMSPFCPGRTLSDCPSPAAAEWRQEIRSMVAGGRSAKEIQAEFERRAGADLSGSPRRDASYTVPVTLGALALGVLVVLLFRLRRRRAPNTAAGEAAAEKPAPLDEERLRRELEREEGGFDGDEDR
jgi:cytochrome c-type biogenesis protein CcmH/NrfF